MCTDPDVDVNPPPPRPRCPGGDLWYGYTGQSCFYLEFQPASFGSYDEANQQCLNMSENTAYLATLNNGYESALLEGIMHARGISSAWIGLSSSIDASVCFDLIPLLVA